MSDPGQAAATKNESKPRSWLEPDGPPPIWLRFVAAFFFGVECCIVGLIIAALMGLASQNIWVFLSIWPGSTVVGVVAGFIFPLSTLEAVRWPFRLLGHLFHFAD
ncbi:MAG: hypothetical protein AAF078_13695 [Planctomycetota bacterium]